MKQSASQDTRDAGTDMGASPSPSGTRRRANRNSPPRIPGWVKISAIVILVLVLLFVVLHLTGHDFGDHMHLSGMKEGGVAR